MEVFIGNPEKYERGLNDAPDKLLWYHSGSWYHGLGNSGILYVVLKYLHSIQEGKMIYAMEMYRMGGASGKPMESKCSFCNEY
jgi:hypothetical protein